MIEIFEKQLKCFDFVSIEIIIEVLIMAISSWSKQISPQTTNDFKWISFFRFFLWIIYRFYEFPLGAIQSVSQHKKFKTFQAVMKF